MASQTHPQQSAVSLMLLLLLLLVVGILVLPTLNTGVNVRVQNGANNSCPSVGQSFDTRQEAFTLAQTAEDYRRTNPFGGNYGLGSYTICYSNGAEQRNQSIPFKGYDNKNDNTKPFNYFHSEQATYGWLQNQLLRSSIDSSKVTAIYAVIFSQIAVCLPCQRDMRSWQQILRQKARSSALFLSIWEIPLGKGFDPATYPAGIESPIALGNLRQVPIRFDP